MTVSVQETRFPYIANGVTTVFAYGCQILLASDLHVFFGDVEITSGFSVSGIGAATGGQVTFVAAPPAGVIVTLERLVPLLRATDYQQNGDFKAKTVNPDFDRLWMVLQQMRTVLGTQLGTDGRVLKLGQGDINGQGSYRAQQNRIQDLGDPVLDQDAANRRWVQGEIGRLLSDGTGRYVLDLLAALSGASLIGFQQVGGPARTVQDKLRETVSSRDLELVGDNATDNAAAFAKADALGVPVRLPAGIYYCSGYTPTGLYYGEGSIRLAGVVGYNGESLAFTFPLDPAVPTSLAQYVMNYNSGALKEQSFNVRIGQNCAPNHKDTEGFIVAVGGRAMEASGTGDNSSLRCTAVGANALRRADDAFSATAIGDSAMEHGADVSRMVAVGSNAMQFAGDIAPQNHFHEFHVTPGDPYGLEARSTQFRTTVGAFGTPANLPVTSDDAKESVAVGRNALLHAVRVDNDTAIGYNAMAHGWNTARNTAVGSSALRDAVSAVDNAAFGNRAGELNQTGYQNVMFGAQALALNVHSHSNTAIGYRAAYSLTGGSTTPATAYGAARQNVAIGAFAMENATSGVNNVAIGNSSFKALAGVTQSVAIGVIAGEQLTTGANNTFIGYGSGRTNLDGTAGTARTNATAIGFDARVSGDNQVQFGNASTTTYVYGTVQNRSDLRDKAEVRETSLDLDWIMGLRPVEGRWDMRDDYIEDVTRTRVIEVPSALVGEDGKPLTTTATEEYTETVVLPRDGSKKRNRLHQWFIAQEVKELSDRLAVEFGGYQDHSINGGCDVLSLGYDEFIPPIVRALQQVKERQDALELRISALEDKS